MIYYTKFTYFTASRDGTYNRKFGVPVFRIQFSDSPAHKK